MTLHLVKSGAARKARQTDTNSDSMIQCPRCGGRELTVTIIGARLKAGKISGGTKQALCALCLLNGWRVAIG